MSDLDICCQLPYETFLRNIIAIKTLSDEITDGWQLIQNDEQDAYLIFKKVAVTLKSVNICEYHVTYNHSYGVPVLCFNVWNSDGKLLSVEDAWVFCNRKFVQDDNMYSVLTQQDHPVLQKPFLTLHPCKTQEIMSTFIGHSNNVVVSWLSAIGPAVNLNLDIISYEPLTKLNKICKINRL